MPSNAFANQPVHTSAFSNAAPETEAEVWLVWQDGEWRFTQSSSGRCLGYTVRWEEPQPAPPSPTGARIRWATVRFASRVKWRDNRRGFRGRPRVQAVTSRPSNWPGAYPPHESTNPEVQSFEGPLSRNQQYSATLVRLGSDWFIEGMDARRDAIKWSNPEALPADVQTLNIVFQITDIVAVSYTHLTLPTNREV